MLTVTSVVGNVSANTEFAEAYRKLSASGDVETILLSRPEAQKSRLRRRSDAGTDVAIALEEGHRLRNGDVLLSEGGRMIVVRYEPEDLLRFKIKDGLSDHQRVATAAKLGHLIGNLHRPICTEGEVLYTPSQSEGEAESILKALGTKASWIEVKHVRMVFEPEEGSSSHTH